VAPDASRADERPSLCNKGVGYGIMGWNTCMHSWTTPMAPQMDGFSRQGFALGQRRRLVFQMLVVGCLAMLMTEGCTTLGPRVLQGERINYNLALQHTADEQMLLNLVRLKYRDTPIFLEVSGIATQFSVSASAQAGAELQAHANDLFSVGVSGAYSTQPTVTYTPLQGEDFSQRFLSPLSLDRLMLLYRSGWPLKPILRLCVQRLNSVKNAPRASAPTLRRRVPDYRDFARVVDLIGELERQDVLDIVYESPPVGERPGRLVLRIAPEARELPAVTELTRLLRLAPGKTQYPLVYAHQVVEDEGAANLDYLRVETRSLLGMLFFLAEAIEVPESDTQAGKVTITRSETGELFDWRQVTGDLLRVRVESARPLGAVIAVRYRGSWFYIDDVDLMSKSIFSLLSQLFALQAGKTERMLPILTLPIGK
jgi:hypothetical protein